MRDPRIDPVVGDILHRWEQNFLVTQVTQGCVFCKPSLSAHKDWVGIQFFREWAANSEVVYMEATNA